VEAIAFLDDVTVQRRMSVDLDLPVGAAPDPRLPCLVPITLLFKEPLVSFDLRDEDGSAVPLLTHRQSDWLAWSALVAAAEGIVKETLPDSLVKDLGSITRLEPQPATALLAALTSADGSPEAVALMQKPSFRALVTEVAENFLLFVPILPGRWPRRIIKYSFVETLEWKRPVFRSLVGWRSVRIRIPAPAVDQGGSYHFESRVGSGLSFSKASLVLDTAQGSAIYPAPQRASRIIHIYVPAAPPGSDAEAQLIVEARFMRLPMAALLSSLLTASVLTVGLRFLDTLRTSSIDPVPLLLAVPSIVAILVARPPEEPDLLSRLLTGLRVAVVASGVLSFVAAGLLVIEPKGPHLEGTWRGLMWASWAIFALIGLESLPRSAYSVGRSFVASLVGVVARSLSAVAYSWNKAWGTSRPNQGKSSEEDDGEPRGAAD